MTQRILGLDLGTYSLKMVLLERRYDDFEVLRFLEQPLNHQSRLSHEEQISLALDQALVDDEWLKVDWVSVGLPGHLLSNRVLELPFSNPKRVQEVIDFEIESFVPFPVEELITDFHVMQTHGETSEILSFYTQDQKLGDLLDVLGQHGIDPKYLGSDLVDLSSLAHIAMLPREGFYVICDIGHSKTNICVMEGQNLRYVRTLGVGGAHFTKAIQRSYNLNFEKAESLKLSRGKIYVREGDSDQISRILTHVSEELVTQIKQTIMAFQSRYGQIPVSAIYSCGGGTKLVGLVDYMSFHLKTNVIEVEPLNLVTHHIEDPEDVNLQFAPALSIALRPVFANRLPRINFRKGPYAFKQDLQLITSELKSVVALLILMIALGVGHYFYTDHYYAQKRAAIDAQVTKWIENDEIDLDVTSSSRRRSSKSKKSSEVKKYLRATKKKLSELNNQINDFSGKTEISALELMEEVSRRLPPKSELNFQISEFNFTGDFLRITAQTNDPLNAPKVVAALQRSQFFQTVESNDPKSKPGDQWDFTLKIDLKKKAVEEEEES